MKGKGASVKIQVYFWIALASGLLRAELTAPNFLPPTVIPPLLPQTTAPPLLPISPVIVTPPTTPAGCLQSSTVEIGTGSIPADNYPQIALSSPAVQGKFLMVAHGSFSNFIVDLPHSAGNAYELEKDIKGKAEICTVADLVTGQLYDLVTLNLSWTAESGGVYAVKYQYQPYLVGAAVGDTVSTTELYFVDAEILNDDKTGCEGGSSEDYEMTSADVSICAQGYPEIITHCSALFNSQTQVTDARGVMTSLAVTNNEQKRAVTAVLYSHGNYDRYHFSGRGATRVALTGENPESATFERVKGMVKRLEFHSCCTGKGFARNKSPNLLTELSKALSSPQQKAQVCGWQQILTFVHNPRAGRSHMRHTKGDSMVCTPQ